MQGTMNKAGIEFSEAMILYHIKRMVFNVNNNL